MGQDNIAPGIWTANGFVSFILMIWILKMQENGNVLSAAFKFIRNYKHANLFKPGFNLFYILNHKFVLKIIKMRYPYVL
jgi:hypothetical protein